MKAYKVILTSLGAFTLGAGLALLLAPQSGDETRKMIKKYVKKRCPLAKNKKIEELTDEIAEELEEVKAGR